MADGSASRHPLVVELETLREVATAVDVDRERRRRQRPLLPAAIVDRHFKAARERTLSVELIDRIVTEEAARIAPKAKWPRRPAFAADEPAQIAWCAAMEYARAYSPPPEMLHAKALGLLANAELRALAHERGQAGARLWDLRGYDFVVEEKRRGRTRKDDERMAMGTSSIFREMDDGDEKRRGEESEEVADLGLFVDTPDFDALDLDNDLDAVENEADAAERRLCWRPPTPERYLMDRGDLRDFIGTDVIVTLLQSYCTPPAPSRSAMTSKRTRVEDEIVALTERCRGRRPWQAERAFCKLVRDMARAGHLRLVEPDGVHFPLFRVPPLRRKTPPAGTWGERDARPPPAKSVRPYLAADGVGWGWRSADGGRTREPWALPSQTTENQWTPDRATRAAIARGEWTPGRAARLRPGPASAAISPSSAAEGLTTAAPREWGHSDHPRALFATLAQGSS